MPVSLEYLKGFVERESRVSHERTARGKHLMGWLQIRRLQIIANAVSGMALDLGCGDSLLEELLADRSPIVALDVVPEFMLRMKHRLKRGSGVHYIRACAEQLPFRENIFDTIVIADLIEHLPDPNQLLHEARYALRAEGTIIISTPNKLTNPAGIGTPSHVRVYDFWQLRALLAQNHMVTNFLRYPVSFPLPTPVLTMLYRFGFRRYYEAQNRDPKFLVSSLQILTGPLELLSRLLPFLAFSLICQVRKSTDPRR